MEKQEFIEKYNFVKESVISAMDKALERALENEVIDLSKCDGNYLDVYPLMLPARYTDKVACYTKVIITSNLPLNKQYVNEQIEKQKTYNAFLRRINYVIEYDKKGHVKKKTLHKEVSLDEKNT